MHINKIRVVFENLYQLYFTYNENYKKVCEKIAVDVLTEIVDEILFIHS